MSIIQNTLDNINKYQNYTQNTNNLIHNGHARSNNALKYNCNNNIEIITYKIPIDCKKNEKYLENNIINKNNENKTNEIYSKNNNNNLYLINSFSNEEYTKSINYNSSEIIIKCKPMINSTASKSFMKEYSISKRYQEDKLTLFNSIGETEIIPEKEKIKEIEIEKSISNKSDTEKDEEDNNDIDLDFQELLEYQEKNLPIPIELKDNENYKILKIKEMKRLSMPPYKSVKKYGEEIKAKYEKDFRINIFYSSIKKKKPINSLKRLYSSNFPLNKNKKEIERFMIFRDKDIGIYEYWQAHLHEIHIDEDIETDDEQKIIARNFCISEIKQAFDYINLNRNISFVNFNRYKSYFNNNESEKIMEQIINNLEYYNLNHAKGFSN
jgi:hypothetical protein